MPKLKRLWERLSNWVWGPAAIAVCLMSLFWFGMSRIESNKPITGQVYKEKYQAQLIIAADAKAELYTCQREYGILDYAYHDMAQSLAEVTEALGVRDAK